jgi:mannose-6-phosphate isomerase
VNYLRRERAVPAGGFTELDDGGQKLYKSNPHMHMFESAIAWMQIDPSEKVWRDLGAELINLCLTKFIDPATGVIGEYFDASWNPLKENGRFIWEPGHQYEWSWLMSLYEELTKKDLKDLRHKIFNLAEKHGTSPQRKVAFDEMWSDWTTKKISSRFWPQCERIKAAVRLGNEVNPEVQGSYAKAADDALETLFKFFETPKQGMWWDQLSETDTFSGTSSKSSSLYHIVNALEEYIHLRPKMR